jgi:hypothetical protein
MKPGLLTMPWSALCDEERELAVALLADAGRAAAQKLFAAGLSSGLNDEEACFLAYRRLIADVLGARRTPPYQTRPREDLHAAAFCVAFEDERRRLLGLRPVLQDIAWLAQGPPRGNPCPIVLRMSLQQNSLVRVAPHL